MGPKKKKVQAEDKAVEEVKPKPPVIQTLVKIEFKLLNWKFMNFSQRFREDTHLFSIKKLLRERHGRMDDLKLCFHAFTEANEVHDEMLTLQECGLKGVPVGYAQTDEEKELEDKSVPVVQLFYDFKPTNYSDPVVLYFR